MFGSNQWCPMLTNKCDRRKYWLVNKRQECRKSIASLANSQLYAAVAVHRNPIRLDFQAAKKKPTSNRSLSSAIIEITKIAATQYFYDISCFLLIVNAIFFTAFNNMDALDIQQESLLATSIRYGLYIGAVFQMVCLGAVIFIIPKSSTTAGSIWRLLKVLHIVV